MHDGEPESSAPERTEVPALDRLAAAVSALTGDGPEADDTTVTTSLHAWDRREWHAALLSLPLDERTFSDRFQVSRLQEIERLWRWWSTVRHETAPELGGYLGFYLLTLIAMHCSDRMRFAGRQAADVVLSGLPATELSGLLVADPEVRRAVRTLHDPRLPGGTHAVPQAAGAPERQAESDEWDAIDWSRLEFHRHGTTSMILTGRVAARARGRTDRFALKLIIHPFLTIRPIVAATRNYLTEYGRPESDTSPVVRVWASHDSWILMDFLPGRTLAESLAERAAVAPRPRREIDRRVDTEALHLYGTPVLRALADLERDGLHHDDLTPSNIIVQEDDDGHVRARFVDLGVNYLHTGTITGTQAGDSVYVAPEVKRDGAGHDRADVYSLGMLLIAVAGIPHTADGTVPDPFYATSVGAARLLEDLVDSDPARRLLVLEVRAGHDRFEEIARHFRVEVEVLRARDAGRPGGWFGRLLELSPGAGTVARQRRLLEVRAAQARGNGGSTYLRQARRLQRWAWICAVSLAFASAFIITWWSRDLGLEWQARWFEWLDQAFGRTGDGLVFFDDVRAADSPVPDFWGNLPARLTTFTYALVSARLYLNVFAEVTASSTLPRTGMTRLRTVAAEAMIRSIAIGPALLIVLPNLVQRDWWPLFVQVICVYTFVGTQTCLWFADDAVRRARRAGLASVPATEILTLGRLATWQQSMAIYLVPVLGIGTLIQLDLVQDELVYAGFVSLINVGIFYFKSAGTDAPLVRAGLIRASLAAERLDHLAARRPVPRAAGGRPVEWAAS
ncbi:protein kinase domain-containing protein [Myceligenerans pegani]|uniref:non-specific serine/threonine protein kinase n=1 Tax=Myceligenerans pegani TaxID=2776917 RepID=A0ABR9N1C0_9MICO|nr:protein kinase [Myceligenerans sp. TRM 65318]MBE1876878.1 hypothetical protein [Myceligenerans sp. TRM 65318]MBE3019149.1 hypothetical protein [Myceligenerans sp. TRM 65318]